ncbi:metal ABC transporter ATP-binding protein [Marinigracilibium pacificum]|uniref:Metal ABC transporter ATP-binding protein n=1 Tax=Marinigracilibium pacificum TaxID=2729599 RepID=A0A848J2S7_9BACT|nr:metal ABC transporter ATP-binding protein [Marinigracilibium pacificum]NMM50031.1 metal ABC transporter ATP-binding protein [Marinigracilibium pacificum]
MKDQTAIEIHDLVVAYNRKPVLWNIDAHLPSGKIIGIIGPNGAGKSTLIKAMMGLLKPASGNILFFDSPLDKVRERVAYVPQRESVDWQFPVTVMDVVLMGRYKKIGLFKSPGAKDKERAKIALEKVGMYQFKDRQISQLSGGQQQRVFIARALIQDADIYLMDEPFAGVDASTEKAILNLLKEMSSQGKTVVVVHHDLQTVMDFFDWVMMLNQRLVACGETNEVFVEQNLNETYGGKLTLLNEVGQMLSKKQMPQREK